MSIDLDEGGVKGVEAGAGHAANDEPDPWRVLDIGSLRQVGKGRHGGTSIGKRAQISRLGDARGDEG
jgi:hypothetical protein